jgi:hypothetical protein
VRGWLLDLLTRLDALRGFALESACEDPESLLADSVATVAPGTGRFVQRKDLMALNRSRRRGAS